MQTDRDTGHHNRMGRIAGVLAHRMANYLPLCLLATFLAFADQDVIDAGFVNWSTTYP